MINIKRKAIIFGIKGTMLTKAEKALLKEEKPWGIILFSRNIENILQLKKLITDIRNKMHDKKYPILIDQEGGRINRLSKFIDTSKFTGEFFGNLYKNNFKKFTTYYQIYIMQTCYLMNMIGVNINTVPILDVRRKKSHNIIGDRSFSTNPKIVSKVGDFCIKEFHNNSIGTVIKHIPGHGLAKVDSHKATPLVKDKLRKLNKIDFFSFKNKKSLFAMTAHIIYKDIDRIYTATHSKKIISLIRNKIKFENLLISDDISMKSLKFPIKLNINKAFNAGCNLVLHCNGKYNEMITVAENSPKINDFIIKKTSQFYKILS